MPAVSHGNADVCKACDRTNLTDCPVCRAPMGAVTHEGLRLDTCKKCDGVWFDRGELRRLLDGQLTSEALLAKGFRPEDAVAVAGRRGDASKGQRMAAAIVGLLTGWF